jgi:hypothetical protein
MVPLRPVGGTRCVGADARTASSAQVMARTSRLAPSDQMDEQAQRSLCPGRSIKTPYPPGQALLLLSPPRRSPAGPRPCPPRTSSADQPEILTSHLRRAAASESTVRVFAGTVRGFVYVLVADGNESVNSGVNEQHATDDSRDSRWVCLSGRRRSRWVEQPTRKTGVRPLSLPWPGVCSPAAATDHSVWGSMRVESNCRFVFRRFCLGGSFLSTATQWVSRCAQSPRVSLVLPAQLNRLALQGASRSCCARSVLRKAQSWESHQLTGGQATCFAEPRWWWPIRRRNPDELRTDRRDVA